MQNTHFFYKLNLIVYNYVKIHKTRYVSKYCLYWLTFGKVI